MLDINRRVLDAEFLLTGYGSFVDRAIQLVDLGDPNLSRALRNAGFLHESVA